MSVLPVTERRAGASRQFGGFTLVEVLVALLVMAVMAGMAWRGVDGIVRTRDASEKRLEQTLRIDTVIAQWEQDLRAVQDSATLPQALSCDGTTVRMSRHTPTGMQVVAWSLRPDGGGTSSWVRWAGPAVTTNTKLQDSWLRSLQLQGTEPGSLRALSGLAQWQVYFYQGNGWANCQSTGDLAAAPVVATAPTSAPSSPDGGGSTPAPPAAPIVAQRQALPAGVRLLLSFAPGAGVTGDLTRDVQVGP